MAAILTDKFRVLLAQRFRERVFADETDSNANTTGLWLFFARPRGWTDPSTGNATSVPNSPIDNQEKEFDIYDQMIGLKKIPSSEIRPVIRNNKWLSGNVYDYYRHDFGSIQSATSGQISYIKGFSNEVKLYETNFYVVTSEYKVYKCIDNNNNSASTVEPSSTSQSPFILSDGYTWKYMFTINANDFEKFKSDEYIPIPSTVQTSNSIDASSNYGGAIYKVDINLDSNGDRVIGSGYIIGNTFNIVGDGQNAQVRVIATNENGGITKLKVINPGSGYTYGQIDTTKVVDTQGNVTTGTGTGASLKPIISQKEGIAVDFAKELGANKVLLHTKLEPDDFVFKNDFTVVGLLLNPTFTNSNITSTAIGTHVMNLSADLSSYNAPEDFEDVQVRTTSGTAPYATGTVVHYETDGSTVFKLYFLQENIENYGIDSDGVRTAFDLGDTIQVGTSSTGTVSSSTGSVISPEVVRGSGDIIYIDNRNAISRAEDQTEDFKIILEF